MLYAKTFTIPALTILPYPIRRVRQQKIVFWQRWQHLAAIAVYKSRITDGDFFKSHDCPLSYCTNGNKTLRALWQFHSASAKTHSRSST